jgi:hypothetical protein
MYARTLAAVGALRTSCETALVSNVTAWSRGLAVLPVLLCCGGEGGGDHDAEGGYQCHEASDCESLVVTGVEELRSPADEPPAFVSRCERATLSSGPNQALLIGSGDDVLCTCGTANGDVGWLLYGGGSECRVYGRTRQCLYEASAFTTCDPNEPVESCRETCETVASLLADDARRSYEARVRSNRCVSHDCQAVLEIDGICYLNHSKLPHDCALSDDEIVAESPESDWRW